MAKKRNRITPQMSKTIAESSPLIKKSALLKEDDTKNRDILEISLEKMKQNPFQPRIDINVQSLNELISSIEQNGLLQPIIVTKPDKDGNHTIIAGHRRFEAYKIMGKEKIKAIVLDNVEEKELAIYSLTENLMRENLHPLENAIAIKHILDQKIVESQNKLAEYVGFSKGYVSKLLNLLKLPSTIVKKIKEDNYKDINVLVLLNKIDDEETMNTAYEEVKDLNRAEAEKYIKTKYLMRDKDLNKNEKIQIKSTKSKISIDINTKKLSDKKQKEINEKIELFKQEMEKLLLEEEN